MWWASSSGVHSLTTQRPHLRLHGVAAIGYNSRSHLVFLQDKINSAHYIAQVVNPRLLPFLRRECGVFSRTTHIHMQLLRRNVLFVVSNKWTGQQAPRSLANWALNGYDEKGTYSFSKVCHSHCRIATVGARCLGQSIAGWYSAPLWLLCARIHPCIAVRGGTLCIEVTVWIPLTVMCVSFGLNLLSVFSTQGQVFHCKLRHQGCSFTQRQVFHRKLRNQECSLTRDK